MVKGGGGTVIVSACLVGIECRYDGKDSFNKKIIPVLKACTFFPVCPEQLGGLSTPRVPSSLKGGDGSAVICGKASVVDAEGRDVTAHYLRGAHEVLKLARKFGVKKAYLKSKSPSCGCGQTYVDGKLVKGDGVLAALLTDHGIKVHTV